MFPACELGTTEEPEIRARPSGGLGSCAPRELQPGGRSGDWPQEGFQEGRGRGVRRHGPCLAVHPWEGRQPSERTAPRRPHGSAGSCLRSQALGHGWAALLSWEPARTELGAQPSHVSAFSTGIESYKVEGAPPSPLLAVMEGPRVRLFSYGSPQAAGHQPLLWPRAFQL